MLIIEKLPKHYISNKRIIHLSHTKKWHFKIKRNTAEQGKGLDVLQDVFVRHHVPAQDHPRSISQGHKVVNIHVN